MLLEKNEGNLGKRETVRGTSIFVRQNFQDSLIDQSLPRQFACVSFDSPVKVHAILQCPFNRHEFGHGFRFGVVQHGFMQGCVRRISNCISNNSEFV